MAYKILVDGKPVCRADTESEARTRAENVQANIARYISPSDDLVTAFAVVGFAPSDDLSRITYIEPRDSVPDALRPVISSHT